MAGYTGGGGGRAAKDWKDSVLVATTVALPANTRTGNVLEANVNGALPAIDGETLTVTTPKKRVLVKNEVAGENNGIFDVLDVGSAGTKWRFQRSPDAASSADVTPELRVSVEKGTMNKEIEFYLATQPPIVLNTTALMFLREGVTLYDPLGSASEARAAAASDALTKADAARRAAEEASEPRDAVLKVQVFQ